VRNATVLNLRLRLSATENKASAQIGAPERSLSSKGCPPAVVVSLNLSRCEYVQQHLFYHSDAHGARTAPFESMIAARKDDVDGLASRRAT
jgi:hypothetical protein